MPHDQSQHTKHCLRLDGGAASLIVDCSGAEPVIVYWGQRLPVSLDFQHMVLGITRPIPPNALAIEPPISLTPSIAAGFVGSPGLQGHVPGGRFLPPLKLIKAVTDAQTITVTSHAHDQSLTLTQVLNLDAETGVLQAWARLDVGDSVEGLVLDHLSAPVIPLDGRIDRLLTMSGRWAGEFAIQDIPFLVGAVVRENRRGRTSHDCFPGLIGLSPGAGESTGLAFGFHLAASGNHSMRAEKFSDGRAYLAAGELLWSGECIGQAGDTYQTPVLHACISTEGLTGIARAFQAHVRKAILPANLQAKPRQVHYNTWEAVYFDHDPAVLSDLATRAAALGVERFVLDDGWFGGRRHDRAGLGDWTVSVDAYPQGLGPLIDHVQNLGMEFGLWVEPEMANPDSVLLRAHPDWVLSIDGVAQLEMRHQCVLDLTRAEVCAYLFERLHSLLSNHPIAYLKWDMNRDLNHPGGKSSRPVTSAQTHAVHALIDRLRSAHPHVEIESCASGGGRANYEILRRTERIWTSDSNDALDRLAIQRGCSLFFPPEVMGSHVGPRDCHITGRKLSMEMRAGVALFGHMGLEMDLRELTARETETLKAAISLHKRLRPLLHHGVPVRLERKAHEERWGVVSHDRKHGLFGYALTGSLPDSVPGRFWCGGLQAETHYQLQRIWPQREAQSEASPNGLAALEGQILSGAQLMLAGVELPLMRPQQLLLFELTAASKA